MDRELVLAILVALLCGGALTAGGWCPTGLPLARGGRALERRAWRHMWTPFVPAMLLFAALCGWALKEPERAERVPTCLLWGAVPFALILTRAAWRALRSLNSSREHPGAATIGVFRPRIFLSPQIVAALDANALAAAAAHEQAHARHRDPLRLWLAQLGSDLLWPWPMAASRFLYWRRALELARDEEVRCAGIAGADLAAAILAALRLSRTDPFLGVATLGGDESFVEDRIARLMRPLESATVQSSGSALRLLAVTGGVMCAVLLGAEFGERVVRTLLVLV